MAPLMPPLSDAAGQPLITSNSVGRGHALFPLLLHPLCRTRRSFHRLMIIIGAEKILNTNSRQADWMGWQMSVSQESDRPRASCYQFGN